MSKKSNFEEYSGVVKRAFAREAKKMQEMVDHWDTKKGHRVKHLTYLLTGRIAGVTEVPMSTTPRIHVEWDNGAESLELISNISLVKLERKKR